MHHNVAMCARSCLTNSLVSIWLRPLAFLPAGAQKNNIAEIFIMFIQKKNYKIAGLDVYQWKEYRDQIIFVGSGIWVCATLPLQYYSACDMGVLRFLNFILFFNLFCCLSTVCSCCLEFLLFRFLRRGVRVVWISNMYFCG